MMEESLLFEYCLSVSNSKQQKFDVCPNLHESTQMVSTV